MDYFRIKDISKGYSIKERLLWIVKWVYDWGIQLYLLTLYTQLSLLETAESKYLYSLQEKEIYAVRAINASSDFLSLDLLATACKESVILSRLLQPRHCESNTIIVPLQETWKSLIEKYSKEYSLSTMQITYLIIS